MRAYPAAAAVLIDILRTHKLRIMMDGKINDGNHLSEFVDSILMLDPLRNREVAREVTEKIGWVRDNELCSTAKILLKILPSLPSEEQKRLSMSAGAGVFCIRAGESPHSANTELQTLRQLLKSLRESCFS